MAPPRGMRVSVPLKQKLSILEDVRQNGLSKTDIAKKYSIPKSTLSTIIKSKEKILHQSSRGVEPGRKRIRNAKFAQLESALTEWLRMMRGKNVPINGKLLTEKADDFALRMKLDGFKASTGWLQKFKLRHGLTFCKLSGESASVDHAAASSWKEDRLKDILQQYSPNDIFNADETGLMFQQLPDKTLSFKKEKCNGGKKAKSRITLLVCSNMSGTEKLPLLVIGKFKKPRCFKGIKRLPTKYDANKKAWMTASIFTEWVQDLDKKMVLKQRKILLLVDNCTAHVPIENLKAITLEFLPPNLTCVIQPMDQGVIQCLKAVYRRSLIKRIILNAENGKDYQIDVLGAIHLACFAWNAVSSETIVNYFRHAGFVSSVHDVSNSLDADLDTDDVDDEALLESLRSQKMDITGSFRDYVNFDSDLVCIQETTDETIVAEAMKDVSVLQENDCANTNSSDEDDSQREPKPTRKDVLKAVDVIRRYFEEEEENGFVLSALSAIDAHVFKYNGLLQQKITSFFQPR